MRRRAADRHRSRLGVLLGPLRCRRRDRDRAAARASARLRAAAARRARHSPRSSSPRSRAPSTYALHGEVRPGAAALVGVPAVVGVVARHVAAAANPGRQAGLRVRARARRRRRKAAALTIALVVAIGLLGGVLAGLFGVGGGIIFVPTLALGLGLTQLHAEATSLLAILPTAVVGSWRQHRYGNVDVRAAAFIGVASIAGVQVGVLARRVAVRVDPAPALRRAAAVHRRASRLAHAAAVMNTRAVDPSTRAGSSRSSKATTGCCLRRRAIRERTELEVEFVASQIPAGARVLDVPCGTGRIAVPLAERGFLVSGLDISETVLARARASGPGARLPPGRHARAAVAGRLLRRRAEPLDGVRVLRDSRKRTSACSAEVARVLAPGGVFVLDTVNQTALVRGFRPQAFEELETGRAAAGAPLRRDHGPRQARWTFLRDGRRSELSFDHRVYTTPEYVAMLRRAACSRADSSVVSTARSSTWDTWRQIIVARETVSRTPQALAESRVVRRLALLLVLLALLALGSAEAQGPAARARRVRDRARDPE